MKTSKRIYFLALVLLPFVSAVADAQALREYTWKSRTEIVKDGEVKSTKLFQTRYAADGTLDQELLAESSPKLPKIGLRGMIAKKKKEESVKLVEALGQLAKAYGNLPQAKMQEIMTRATKKMEATGLLRLEAAGVLQPGDSMIVWIDPSTRRQRRVEVQTSHDAKPVRIVSEFQDLGNGPNYMARSVIDYPSEELSVVTENFEYTRISEGRAQ